MGWNERSDPDMRTANFCDVYREGVYNLNAIVKSLWIKASAKCINVNVMSQVSVLCYFMLSQALEICGQCASPIMHWAPLVSSFC